MQLYKTLLLKPTRIERGIATRTECGGGPPLIRARVIGRGSRGRRRRSRKRPRVVGRVLRVWWRREVTFAERKLSERAVRRIPEKRLGQSYGWAVRPLHPPPSAIVPLLKHILKSRVQRPVISLPLPAPFARDLHKTLIKAKVVPDTVLPTLLVFLVIRELVCDKLVDPAQRQAFVARLLDCHGNQRHVWVGWFNIRIWIPGFSFWNNKKSSG